MNPGEIRRRLRNYATAQLSSNRQWFQLVNQTATRPNQLHIYDEIGFFGVSASDLVDQLNGTDGPVDVYINSPGGEIFDGIAIYNALSRRDTSVYIDGIAASAASFIAMAAAPGKLGIAKTGRMMIHNGMAFAAGDAQEMRKLADILEAETANIAGIYADRTGQPAERFLAMMAEETWLGAQDAVREGLADYMYDPRHGPANIILRRSDFRNADAPDYQGWCVRDGQWVFDPDGDGDDDSSPEGDTDHDYFDADGKSIKPIPPKPKIAPSEAQGMGNRAPVRNADSTVDNSPWDASRAWHNGSTSDNPEEFYRAICAGERTVGDPATQAHWALPYKYTPSSPPNAAAVRDALARLSAGVNDLKDPAGVKSKLEGLMKEINPDYEPSDDLDVHSLGAFLLQTLRGGK